MEDFGSYLKSERELRGVPLEEISTTTKIPIRFLLALENNQFDDLPGEVFTKGYIRSFAKVIGANEGEMLSAYDEVMKKSLPNKQSESALSDKEISKDKSFILGLVFTVVFLAAMGWGVNILIKKSNENKSQSKPVMLESDHEEVRDVPSKILPATTIEVENELVAPEETKKDITTPSNDIPQQPIQSVESLPAIEDNTAITSKTTSNKTIDISKNENSSTDSVAESDMPLKLTIKVKDDVWFHMVVDESREEDFILPNGTMKSFYGKDNFRLTAGNRDAIDLKLNNKALALPDGDENKVMREFIINSRLIE